MPKTTKIKKLQLEILFLMLLINPEGMKLL